MNGRAPYRPARALARAKDECGCLAAEAALPGRLIADPWRLVQLSQRDLALVYAGPQPPPQTATEEVPPCAT